jgi:hypothetical protein
MLGAPQDGPYFLEVREDGILEMIPVKVIP